MKKFLKISGTVLFVIAILFFWLAPGIADRLMNKVVNSFSGIKKVDWYDSTPFIADLHCDALLWNRYLLKRAGIGLRNLPAE